jgi:hypothetical protein
MIAKTIFYFSRRYFLRSPWFWWLLAAWQGLFAVVLLRALEEYLALQPRLQTLHADSGLLMQVFLPVYHWLAPWLLLLLAGLLFSALQVQRTLWRLYGVAFEAQWQGLVQLIFWLTLLVFLPLFFASALLVFGFFSELYQWLALNLAFWLLLFAVAALALCLFRWLPLGPAWLFLLLFWSLFLFWPTDSSVGDAWLPRVHWQSWAAGALSWTSLAYFLFFIAFFLGLAWCKTASYWRTFWRLLLFFLLVLILGAALLPIFRENSGYWDVTRQQVHRVPLALQQAAEKLPSPLTIKVFLSKDHALGPAIQVFFAKYQRLYPQWQLQIIDPQQEPQAVPEAVTHLGQALLIMDDKKEIIDFLNEKNLSLGISRLLQNYQVTWWFITGHGEAPLLADRQQGLRRWLVALQQQGLPVRQSTFLTKELLDFQEVPPLLVLAGNQLPLLSQELEILENFFNKGGRLLWLLPPSRQVTTESLAIEEQLMQLLDTLRIPGVVVHAEAGTDSPFLLPVMPLPAQRIVQVGAHFPYAAAFQVLPTERWQVTPLLQSDAQSFADQQWTVPFVATDEEAVGHLTVAVAYERQHNESNTEKSRGGRVLLLGSVAWLTNQFWDLPGSQELRTQLWAWLYPQPIVSESKSLYPLLKYPDSWLYGVSALLLFVLPLSFVLIGVFWWWKKKYA